MRILSGICLFLMLFCTIVWADEDRFTVYVGGVPPFNYMNDDGMAAGIAVDVMDEVMRESGAPISVSDIQSISWARALNDTENIPDTMTIGVAWTPQRKDMFKWVGPVGAFRLGLVAKKNSKISINSPEDLRKYRIGVIRDSAPVHILNSKLGIESSELHELVDDGQMFRMLDVGRVDLIAQADTAAPSAIQSVGLELDDFAMVFVLRELELFAAFNKATDDALIQRAQGVLDVMKSKIKGRPSRYETIVHKYMKHGLIKIH